MSERVDPQPVAEPSMRRRLWTAGVVVVVWTIIWFAVAGRLDWWQGWAFIGLYVAYVVVVSLCLWRRNPGLFRERTRGSETAERWDQIIMRCYTILLLVELFLAALDAGRFRWSAAPVGLQVLGWVAMVALASIVWHVTQVNDYLAKYARLQKDRGQVVITSGLYHYVRHPMYLGLVVAFPGLALALGSCWAVLPGLCCSALIVYRTAREDRMLRESLEGYAEYAEHTRYRLVPGIW